MSSLPERVLTTPTAVAHFSDAALVAAMLRFEVGLARAQASAGLIPPNAAQSIANASESFHPDIEQLVQEGAHTGSLAIAFVKQLTQHVATTDAGTAAYVHFGSTSQDLLDTALALCTQGALRELDALLIACRRAAALLATTHADTPALARTLLQPAGLTTFGLKAAYWARALEHTRLRIAGTAPAARALSLGGASGNLAALGAAGASVRAALAAALGLTDPGASWHTQREHWVALACDSALAAGAMSKIAHDIALMAQFEVAEVFEPAAAGRGGSSAMPHKRNPVLSLRVLANTQLVPALVAQLLAAMKQEHERALGNWQAEQAVWPRVFIHTLSAAHALAELLRGLQVDAARCRRNIDALEGVLHAERLAHCFATAMDKPSAHQLAAELSQQALREQRSLRTLALASQASNARLAQIAVAKIEACFSEQETLALCAAQARAIAAPLA